MGKALAHVAFGVLTALVSVVQPVLSVINTAIYVLYQLDEELHLKDVAYEELLEFTAGLSIGEIVLVVLHLV